MKLPRFSNPIARGALSLLGALLFVVIWYFAAQMATGSVFDVKPSPAAYPHDLAAHLVLGALLFAMARSLPRFMLASSILFGVLTAGNAAKLAILGAPVMPDDFVAARNMLLLLDGWLLVGAVLLVVVPLVLFGWMIAWRRPRAWIGLGVIALGISVVVSSPAPIVATLDKAIGNSVWNQPGNYRKRGLPIHLLQETARQLSRGIAPPSEAEVTAALATLGSEAGQRLIKVSSASPPTRNLHLIVLESFWDPMPLEASRLSADPVAPEFRDLWAAAGHSHLLAPVFGGYTANTELEVLCGFPVTADNVYFETGLRRDASCLPRHLAEAGYHTLASHPNAASFWNRVNAYRRIGFQTYLADKDFEMDDMNRAFLSDASLYRQILARIEPELRQGRPLLNYVLTYFGHLPYPLNDSRPAVIEAAEGHEVVAAYANTIYYKSRELMELLETLRAADPDALIVLFGDHLPALKPNFGGYTDSGLLAKQRGELEDEMFRTLTQTPLIVIDGTRGPVQVGDVPAYELPALLLDLLGDRRPTILRLAQRPEGSVPIRPLPGVHFALDGDQVRVCRGTDDDARQCETSSRWVQAIETLRDDLLGGDQHGLVEIEAPSKGFREASVEPSDPAGERYF